MAYDWRYDTGVSERVHLCGYGEGWLTRLLQSINALMGFAKTSGDFHRKV